MPAGAALSRVRNAGQYNPPLLCGCSSVDRVLASEAKGRGFDPRQPHHFFTFLITPLFSGFVGGLELDSLDLATFRPVI